MLVAITGGTGFIGLSLVNRHLDRGDSVRVLSRKRDNLWENSSSVEVIQGDLVTGVGVDAFVNGVDVLYHCAGEINCPSRMYDLHVQGTNNLLQACSGRVNHWVQLSSVGVYGPVRDGIVTEQSPINPVGEYEITKAESDRIVLNAADQGDFSCSVLRPSNVFGADMKNQSLFGMINMIDRGLFFFMGRPGASANYIHVDNVVTGLLHCGTMKAAKGKVYNLSDHCSMEKFVQVISEELGCRSPVLRMPELPVRWAAKLMEAIPGIPLTQARVDALTNRCVYSIDSIQESLGYSNVVSMEDGLRQMVAAYKSKQ